MVEDAVAGIQAAKAGQMAALGVPRADDRELLNAAGPTWWSPPYRFATWVRKVVRARSVPLTSPWESFLRGPASTPRVPRRADRCDARSGGRSPLARSVT